MIKTDFEIYCETLDPLWNTHISRTYAEQFFYAGKATLQICEFSETTTDEYKESKLPKLTKRVRNDCK